jgi:hypothetical protein
LIGTSAVYPAMMPFGDHLVALRVTDSMGEFDLTTINITVRDTTPPTLTVDPRVPVLWPPNHRMVTVPVTWLASDVCDAAPTVVLESVASSEPDDAAGNGDGSTTGDIAGVDHGTPDTNILLRAERAGEGAGRLYDLAYRVTDASQNSAQGLAIVSVPHALGSGPETLLMQLEPNGLPGKAHIYWPSLADSLGYDVIAADLSNVSLVDEHLYLPSVQVLARGTQATSIEEGVDGPLPPLGKGIIYLIQQRTVEGGAGYGTATAPWPRLPSSCDGGCP